MAEALDLDAASSSSGEDSLSDADLILDTVINEADECENVMVPRHTEITRPIVSVSHA